MRPARLLTIGHSYVVGLNRRLAHEMAVAGEGRWEVTAAAPRELPGDLRDIVLEPIPGERSHLVGLRMAVPRSPHLRFYRGLRRVMAQGWDVVHCWEEPYVVAGWQIARETPARTKLVVATFQNIAKRYPPPFSSMERSVLRRADAWIPFGHTVLETLRGREGFDGSRPAAVIGPGVDLERFYPDPEARANVRASLGWIHGPIVGYLGRFVPEKGIALLLAALTRVAAPWRALFVGSGPMRPAIETFAAAHPGRVRIIEGVPHDGVPAYLNAMDVLCAPSQTTPKWREQFGRMLIEAMACGVPVVASPSGEIPHVVGSGGLLLGEADVERWSATLDALLADHYRRHAIGGAGLARARSEYAWPVVARRHLEFMESVVRR
jgi:glycosyltransferase involved in cell wall biosynthesis